MLSTALELAGFALIAAGTYLLAGTGVTFLVGGAELLFLGYATDGGHPVRRVLDRRALERAAAPRQGH